MAKRNTVIQKVRRDVEEEEKEEQGEEVRHQNWKQTEHYRLQVVREVECANQYILHIVDAFVQERQEGDVSVALNLLH